MKNSPLSNAIKVLIVFLFFAPLFSHAAIVTRNNLVLNCQEYEVIYSDPENKRDLLAEALSNGAQLYDGTSTTGFSLVNLRIDFANQKVTVDVEQHIFLAFNRLILTDVTLSANNPKLTEYINRLNYDYFLSRSVCVNSENELIELR